MTENKKNTTGITTPPPRELKEPSVPKPTVPKSTVPEPSIPKPTIPKVPIMPVPPEKTNTKTHFISPLKLPEGGQEFKNYKELVRYLGLPVLDGKSKKYQLEQLKRYFKWIKEGNKYKITEVYTTPLQYIEKRGTNKPLQEYQVLFNTVMMYELAYGQRSREHPEGESKDCVSYTKTELRQKLFKLVNRDFYSIRKDIRRAEGSSGLLEEILRLGDRTTSDKVNGMSFRGFQRLKEECGVDVGEGMYIYYIKISDFLEGGEKAVRCRVATDEERSIITGAGWISLQEYKEEFKEMGYEEKIDPETYREKRGRRLLRSKLKILNGTDNIEDIVGEIMAAYDEEHVGDHMGDQTGGHVGQESAQESEEAEEELFMKYIKEVFEGKREMSAPLLELIKKGKGENGGLNRYALERGEFWVNIVERVKFFLPPRRVLLGVLATLANEIKTLPEAQEKLNNYMIEWMNDKADKWGSFSEKFLIERATGSKDITRDMKKFTERYINLKGVERSYEWQEYEDEDGNIWKMRYAGNKMTFDEVNLKVLIGECEGKDTGSAVVIWNAPHQGEVCTNCTELVELARKVWTDRGWMPIEGFMGGFWDEKKGGGAGGEVSCFILSLGDVGVKLLKIKWDQLEQLEQLEQMEQLGQSEKREKQEK